VLVAHEEVAGPVRRSAQHLGRLGVGRQRLEAGVDRDHARRIGADHPGVDQQRGLVGAFVRPVAGDVADQVLAVHEHVRADLELGEDPQFGVDPMRAGARAGDDRRRAAGGGQGVDHRADIGAAILQIGLAVGEALDVLLHAAIALQAGIDQTRLGLDGLQQRDGGLGRGDAGAVDAGIQVDDHLQRLAGGAGGFAESGDIGRVSTTVIRSVVVPFSAISRAMAGAETTGEVISRPVVTTALGQDLGLADLGAAQAHRPGGDLQPGDVDALVGLGVRPQLDALAGRELRHAGDVALQGGTIDHQHRGVEVAAGTGGADQAGVQVLVGHGGSRQRPKSCGQVSIGELAGRVPGLAGGDEVGGLADRAGGRRPSSGCGAWPSADGPAPSRSTASISLKAGRQGILAYWWNEIEAPGPALNGLIQMSSPAARRNSNGKVIGRRRLRMWAMAAFRVGRPAARGSSYSISSKRMLRSDGKISWAGPTRRLGLPAMRMIRRCSGGVRIGTAAQMSQMVLKVASLSSPISRWRATGASASTGMQGLEDHVVRIGKDEELHVAGGDGQLVQPLGDLGQGAALDALLQVIGGNHMDPDLDRHAQQSERQALSLVELGVQVGPHSTIWPSAVISRKPQAWVDRLPSSRRCRGCRSRWRRPGTGD
jgi:hypothetical protein